MLKNMVSAVMMLTLIFPSMCYAGSQSQTQGAYTSAEEDQPAPPEELSAQIDKTIEVLSVIKEELKRAEAEDKAKTKVTKKGAVDTDKESVEQIRGKLSAMIRMWKKTEKIMKKDASKGAKSGVYTTDTAVDDATEQLNHKIDNVIRAMEIIKEEIEAADEPVAKKK